MHLGPVVQSIVSLTSSLVVKMLTVLVSTILNSQVFLLKNVSSFCKCKSYSHFSRKNIRVYAIFNDQSFNEKLMTLLVFNNWAQQIWVYTLCSGISVQILSTSLVTSFQYKTPRKGHYHGTKPS